MRWRRGGVKAGRCQPEVYVIRGRDEPVAAWVGLGLGVSGMLLLLLLFLLL